MRGFEGDVRVLGFRDLHFAVGLDLKAWGGRDLRVFVGVFGASSFPWLEPGCRRAF